MFQNFLNINQSIKLENDSSVFKDGVKAIERAATLRKKVKLNFILVRINYGQTGTTVKQVDIYGPRLLTTKLI